MNRTAGALLRRIEEATGVSALVEISEFFTAMSSLFEGFGQRVQRVYELLRSPQTAFVLVASPAEPVLTEAEYFCRQVMELSIPLRGVVFNRVHRESALEWRPGDEQWMQDLLTRTLGAAEEARALVENFFLYEVQARGDDVRIERFLDQVPAGAAVATVPNFAEDLHDLDGLRRMIPYLT